MGRLRLVGSLRSWVFFAEYGLFYRALLQRRPIILRSLLIVATPYLQSTAGQARKSMEWLRLVGSLELYVSFVKEPYKQSCAIFAPYLQSCAIFIMLKSPQRSPRRPYSYPKRDL